MEVVNFVRPHRRVMEKAPNLMKKVVQQQVVERNPEDDYIKFLGESHTSFN
jgi:hypothetical protein